MIAWNKIKPIRDWNDFWFRPQHMTALGLFRIALGLTALMKLFLLLPVIDDFFTEQGMMPLARSQYAIPPPRICLFDYLPLDIAPTFFAVSIVIAVLFTCGFMTRLSTIALFVCMISIDNRNLWVLNSGDKLMQHLLIYSIFAPMGAALSVDRLLALYRGSQTNGPVWGANWAVRLIQLQICTMYLWSTYIKLRGQSWPAGESIYWTSRNIERSRWPMPFLDDSMIGINFLVYFTLLVEGLFPFMVWHPKSRYYIIPAAFMLHLGIEQAMTIQVFSYVVFSSYIVFYKGEEIVAFWERVRSRVIRAAPTPVFYDGDCGFCTRCVHVVQAMDILKRLDFQNFRSPAVQTARPDLDLERCERELVLQDKNGDWYGGFYAFRWMAWRLPTLWLVAPFLYLPGVSWAGDRAYKWIADHRFLFKVGGSTSACALPMNPPAEPAEPGKETLESDEKLVVEEGIEKETAERR